MGFGTESNSHTDVCCFHSVDILSGWHHAGEPCSKAFLHMGAQTLLDKNHARKVTSCLGKSKHSGPVKSKF